MPDSFSGVPLTFPSFLLFDRSFSFFLIPNQFQLWICAFYDWCVVCRVCTEYGVFVYSVSLVYANDPLRGKTQLSLLEIPSNLG